MKDIAACLTGLHHPVGKGAKIEISDQITLWTLELKPAPGLGAKKIGYIITFKNLFKQLTRMGGKKAPFIILHKIGPLLVLHTGIGHGQSAALRV